jgi:hypothetical protein
MNQDLWFTRQIHTANYRKQLRKDKKMYNDSIEQLVGQNIHPVVLQAIDDHGLTALQGLILNYLTDPDYEYTNKEIAQACQNTLGQGSKRSIRRVKAEQPGLIEKIELERLTDVKDKAFTGATLEVPTKTDEGITELGDGGWDVTEELDCVTACSKAPEKGLVKISAVARKKISLFMQWSGQREWLCYLKGSWVNDSTILVNDIVLPNQNASSTLVSNVKVDEYKEIVGVIHSHHDMGHGSEEKPGWSGHDEAYINSNHNVSLLVSNKGIAGHIRVKTPCGAFMRIKAAIKHMDEVVLDEKKLREEFDGNINGSNRSYYDGSSTQEFDKCSNTIDRAIDRIPTRDNYHF